MAVSGEQISHGGNFSARSVGQRPTLASIFDRATRVVTVQPGYGLHGDNQGCTVTGRDRFAGWRTPRRPL